MIVVVYKKSQTAKKHYLKVFMDEKTPDRIINGNARNPLIPHEYPLVEIGMGESFIDYYKSKYRIKNHEVA